jgi:hypothetical protein
MFFDESFGTLADEIDVRTFFENEFAGAHGILDALDAADSAGAKRMAFHEHGIELDFAIAVEEGSAAGIESVIVFEGCDGFFDGVEGGAALFEGAPAGSDGILNAIDVGFDHGVWDVPGAAVDKKDRRKRVTQAKSSCEEVTG